MIGLTDYVNLRSTLPGMPQLDEQLSFPCFSSAAEVG
jgi:hypothetical protein